MIITLQTILFFRESLLNALDRILRPYYNKFSLTFGRKGDVSDDDESDEQVFGEFDEEKGVIFYPPVYLQRYAAVSDCLMDKRWCGKLDKVVDLGYHDMSFIKYLKEVSGIRYILGVDIESLPFRCSSDLIGCDDYGPKRENPLQVTLFQGNAADPDYRLIGCDAVIAIEMIEHMLPHDLDRLVHNIFGFIKPWVAIITTPNGDFNVLFKSMEKNGFRRLDHFFEWSREQFHDWCSNIVTRYPEFTVECKGIGPGPPGTLHLGCCSQMAVFTSKNYQKQQDLNLDSLALVSNVPSPYNVSDLIDTWDSAEELNESNMICPPNNEESYFELNSEKQSCMTILITSPALSVVSLENHDQGSQCNLDIEAGKSYMMFDYEQMCFDIVVPRRKNNYRVYMIEDVTSRLNCTTLQVKKFSKPTQNLIAKNKVDLLVHTREVVDEIRHLTRMLNFNKDSIHQPIENGVHIWHNINWGDNAPYWNQYYKIVKQYNPPYESKSEESRITELISDEINCLIDNQFNDNFSVDSSKLEIPIEHLMTVVTHITDDAEKVKDLLEWDGYEIVDNVVIHSRLMVDNASTAGTQENDWQDNETCSDWDSTDVHSTTLSDASTLVPDLYARCLHRALDQKVRKLRTMLTGDEDITSELDKVVCRLMKLALRTSKGRTSPPPPRWMQCKLLDLLTLTEKAIEKRRKYFIKNYPLKPFCDDTSEKPLEMLALEKIKDDDTGINIVNKYRHLLPPEKHGVIEGSRAKYRYIDLELEDDLSAASTVLLKDNKYIERHSPSLFEPGPTLTEIALSDPANEKTKLERTQAWLEDDLKLVSHPNHDFDNDISSGDTENSTSLSRYYKKSYKKFKAKKQCIELKCVICKRSHSKSFARLSRREKKAKDKTSNTKIKKVSKNKSSNNGLFKDAGNKYESVDDRTYRIKPRKKECKSLLPTASKPIPTSLIELCHPELMNAENRGTYKKHIVKSRRDDHFTNFNQPTNGGVAAIKNSLLIDIVMDGKLETIAMRRTIGTDAEEDPMCIENETLIRSVSNTVVNDYNFFDKHDVGVENDQTIFLNDINEPSTSKGIRHVSMNVQCGPDVVAPTYSILSATTSITKMPSIFTAGIKIGDSCKDTEMRNIDCSISTKIQNTSADCCTFTEDLDASCKVISPRERTIGIKIKESLTNVLDQFVWSTMTNERTDIQESTKLAEIVATQRVITRDPDPVNMRHDELTLGEKETSMQKKETAIQAQEKTMQEKEMGLRHHEKIMRGKETDIRKQENTLIQQQKFTLMREQESTLLERQSALRQHQSTLREEMSSVQKQEQIGAMREEGSSMREQEFVFIQDHVSIMQKQELIGMQEQGSSIRDQKLTVMQKQILTLQKPEPTVMQKERLTMREQELTTDQAQELHFVQELKSTIMQEQAGQVQALNFVQELKSSIMQEQDSNIMQLDSDRANAYLQLHTELSIEKKCPMSIPITIKTEDAGSEFCGGIVSIPKSHCKKSHFNTESSITKEVGVSKKLTRYVRPKLCCGGVQVHSYKDKESCEDIMYQGEWQNPRNKVLTTRKVFHPVIVKKTITSNSMKNKVNSKENIEGKKKERPVRSFVKRNIKAAALSPTRTAKSTKIKTNERTSTFVPRCVAQLNRSSRSVTKVASKLTMSSATSKKLKPTRIVRKPPATVVSTAKNVQNTTKTVNNDTILPYYLRRTALKSPTIDNKNLNLSVDSAKTNISIKINAPIPALIRSKTEEIKNKVPIRANYVVLRNEIEKNGSANDGQPAKTTPDSGRKRIASTKRAMSPQSQNSSTCSSPNSIATVRAVPIRAKNVNSRKHSNSSYITSTTTSGSENTTPNKNKKFTKRCKSAKMSDDKTFDNKENYPQTSRHSNITSNISDKITKRPFLGQKKEVFIAQLKESPPLQSSTNKKPKSNINVPKTTSNLEKRSANLIVSDKSSRKSDDWTANNSNKMSTSTEVSNMILIIEQGNRLTDSPTERPDIGNTRFITEWMDNSCLNTDVSQASNIRAAMRMLVEETLDFIDGPYHNNSSIDSQTVILSREDSESPVTELCSSPISFKTVIINENNSLESVLEQALHRSFDTTLGDESNLSSDDTRLIRDFDLLSFKSIPSVSKYSEYLSATSSQGQLPAHPARSTSVKDIYERKEQPFNSVPLNTAGAIAVQAFSGFSINGEPIVGDKPDPINFVDSETGSFALTASRQANSEEIFISGRSSGSIDSGLINDDAVVPSWLFQIISQQQTAEDEMDAPQAVLIPLPIPDNPMYDDNGNVVEGVGLGAGAGDGRGMHSDQSQDSSGRGTSLSSSGTSSGAQSEALLIDPSAFVAQYEGVSLLQDSEDSSIVVVGIIDENNELGNAQGVAPMAPDSQSFSHGENTRRNPLVQATTSNDADVSSLETDVPDSSDN